jgi:hypothetical protein
VSDAASPPNTRRPVALDLDDLAMVCQELSASWAALMGEAAAVCLDHNAHAPGTNMEVTGDLAATAALTWTPPDDKQRRTHADLQDATEDGATAVACALATQLTEYEVIRRAVKRTGFDYWLGKDDGLLFQDAARLEISGILDGDDSAVSARVRQKAEQIQRSNTHLPGYVIVVEFGRPQAGTQAS